eukprot:scaffold35043_cov19-Tisochrysis_lutea.AAC.1
MDSPARSLWVGLCKANVPMTLKVALSIDNQTVPFCLNCSQWPSPETIACLLELAIPLGQGAQIMIISVCLFELAVPLGQGAQQFLRCCGHAHHFFIVTYCFLLLYCSCLASLESRLLYAGAQTNLCIGCSGSFIAGSERIGHTSFPCRST